MVSEGRRARCITRKAEGETPLVSVIMPAYNAERYVGVALRSVTTQSYENLEILVVDDGSEDGTSGLVRRRAAQDRRIRLLQQANKGVASARNAALRMARGRFIAPIDADDVWLPSKIEKQITAFVRCGPEVGVVYAWAGRLDEEGRIFDKERKYCFRGKVQQLLVLQNFCCASAPLIRKECLDLVGAYDSSLRDAGGEGCEDLDLLVRIAEKYEFDVVPEILLGYRRVSGSMSGNQTAMEKSFFLVMEKLSRSGSPLLPKIECWAHSGFCSYLAANCRKQGNYIGAVRYVLKAIFWEIRGIACRDARRSVAGLSDNDVDFDCGFGGACADNAKRRVYSAKDYLSFNWWHSRILHSRMRALQRLSERSACKYGE